MSTANPAQEDVESDEEDFNPQPAVESDAEDAPKSEQSEDDKPIAPGSSDQNRDQVNGDNKDVAEGDDDKNDGQDDDEDEEEDDDDEEEEEAIGRPKKRPRRNQFLDIEAEVEDEDDEPFDDDEDDLLGGEKFVADTHPDDIGLDAEENDDRRHRALDLQREKQFEEDAEAQAARLKEKYGRKDRTANNGSTAIPRRMMMPSVDDPTIWGVRCKPGKEREVVFGVMKRIEERVDTAHPLAIISAFERGGTMAGYVYVEARKQADVMTAMDGMPNAFVHSKLTLVPIGEMPDLLRTRKSKSLEIGMYVRLKRGKYQGDLAQIEEVINTGLEVEVRIVPRLDYGDNEDVNGPDANEAAKRKRSNAFGRNAAVNRPIQRPFSETEARKKHGRHLQQQGGFGKGRYQYFNDNYEDGYLIKIFKVQHLQTENVNPTLEEVTKFTRPGEDGAQNLDLTALAQTLKVSNATALYLPGDMVEVYQGEQSGVYGKAVSVVGDIVTLRVTEGELRGQTIEAPTKGLRKRFREGDHVKVVGGSKYQDEVGMVVKIKDDRITLLGDANNQEITVFSKDLRAAADSAITNADSKYDLYDLVQLDPSTVGCVVKVDRESLKVLDQMGSIRSLLPSNISNRLERRRFAIATDRDGTEIRNDDTVKEFAGEQRQGRVLHIHRVYLFLQNREQTENAGIFVTRSSNVATIAAKGARQATNGPDLTKMNPALQRTGGNTPMPPPVKSMGRDRYIGKTCVVRKGPYKGLLGIVKDTNDTEARIELHTKNKVVSVAKSFLNIKDASGNTIDMTRFSGARPGSFTPQPSYAGNATPRVPDAWAGGRTPLVSSGSATPGWGPSTGGRTPGWKAQPSGARTPAPQDGSRTVNPYADGSRTSYGGATAYGNAPTTTSWNPNTPHHHTAAQGSFAGARTPAWAPTPAHRSYDAPTPGFAAAATPAALDHPTPRGANPYAYGTPAAGAGAPTPGYAAAETPRAWARTPGAEGYED